MMRILKTLLLTVALFFCSVATVHAQDPTDDTVITELTPTQLHEFFVIYNADYFSNSIPDDTSVDYAVLQGLMGITSFDGKRIRISVTTKAWPKVVLGTLLHEMIHAYLIKKGCVEFDPHGHRFQFEMRRIELEGAYDDLL